MKKVKEEIVKEEIIVKAQQLFKQFGLKKTTMDDIASACGKAKSTLYHYYKSKDEVFDEVISTELWNLRLIVKEQVDKENILSDKINVYFIAFHQELLNKLNLYRIVKQEFKENQINHSYFSKAMLYEQEYISKILTDAYNSGNLKGIEKENIPWFSETLIAAFLGIVKYSVEKEKETDIEKLRMVADIIIPRIFI